MATTARAERFPFDGDGWTIQAANSDVVDYLGQRALMMKGGTAFLNDIDIESGLLEFDVAIPPLRSFAGVMFRAQDSSNFEHFYIRAHQSGNPDANQYTPVFNGVSGWQLYYGEDYAVPSQYRHDAWMHIKIAYSGSRAEVYIDSATPSLVINDLKHGVHSGAVGLNASNLAPAHFANFQVSALPDDYAFSEAPADKAAAAPEVVTQWQVSDVFDGRALEGMHTLGNELKRDREWTTLASEATGITNLARVQGLEDDKATVFAKLVVNSAGEQIKGLAIGYSDAVAVYVNDTLIYSGTNQFLTRDYRYLGTVGLFDKVFLPLQKGDNEVWVAVSESFGGWGVQAKFDDLTDIVLKTDR